MKRILLTLFFAGTCLQAHAQTETPARSPIESYRALAMCFAVFSSRQSCDINNHDISSDEVERIRGISSRFYGAIKRIGWVFGQGQELIDQNIDEEIRKVRDYVQGDCLKARELVNLTRIECTQSVGELRDLFKKSLESRQNYGPAP